MHLTRFRLAEKQSATVRTHTCALSWTSPFNCQRSSRAKKRGCVGGRFIMPSNVGKNSQILHKPLKFAFLTIFGREQATIPISLWRKKTSWRVFWRTPNSSPLPAKFAAERIEPENVSELSNDELVRPSWCKYDRRHRLRALYAYAEKKNVSLWPQLLLANAWLFSADVVAVVEGVDVVRKEKFPRWELKNNFHLFSQPPSTGNSVVDRKVSSCFSMLGSVNSKRAHPPPGHLSGICHFVLRTELQMPHGGA